MKLLEKTVKLKVPRKLEDITLEQVQAVLLVDQNPDIEEFAKKVHSVAIMCSASAMEVGSITPRELDQVYSSLFGMINGEQSIPLKRFVNYLGREYAFIEDVRDMETGAFVDIDQMSSNDKYAENLHRIMAILYRPIHAKIGSKYRLQSYVQEDVEERKERQLIFLKHMTLNEVRGAASFFLLVMRKCLNILDDSFPLLPNLMVEEVIRGAGITSFTPSQESASETLKTSFVRGSVKQ